MSDTLAQPLDVKLMNITASALMLGFAVLVLAALASWATRATVFSIGAITVTGDVSHSNALTLRANVAPQLEGTFFTIDLAQARQAFERAPWVRRAVVRRDFPNRLKVVLQEHQAVAHWGPEAESHLLNNFGEVFDANSAEVEQDILPRLIGPDNEAPAVLVIEQFELTGSGAWRVRLDTGAVMELGHGTAAELVARTQRFLKTLTQVTARYGRKPDNLEGADLRYPDGYALKLQGVTTQVPEVKK
jgi:cell division protein FtsQ